MSRRIALLGLSGTGKSTLIGKVLEQVPLLHLQASALIKDEQAYRAQLPDTSEALRTGPVISNQELMIAAFQRAATATSLPVVFDGHSVIDGRDGIVEIPSAVFAALGVEAICFLDVDPELIAYRRLSDTGRPRPHRNAETLASHQQAARAAAARIAHELGKPFKAIADGGVDDLLVAIQGTI